MGVLCAPKAVSTAALHRVVEARRADRAEVPAADEEEREATAEVALENAVQTAHLPCRSAKRNTSPHP